MVKDEFQLGGISYGEKGLDLNNFLGGPILKIEIFNVGRGPIAPMTRECIPILF